MFIRPNRLRFVLPAIVLFALDVAFTLAGQPAQYWAGDRAAANEANPLAHVLLANSPWLFAGMASAWSIVLAVVLGRWTSRNSDRLAQFIAVAHALGGGSWLWLGGPLGPGLAAGYLIVAASFCLRAWGDR